MNAKPSRQLGNILRTVPSATTAGEADRKVEADTIDQIQPPPEQHGKLLVTPEPQPSSDVAVDLEVPLQVTVPKRVRRELLMMAANQDCSVRALILRSVRSLGIEIDEAELRDKRRKP